MGPKHLDYLDKDIAAIIIVIVVILFRADAPITLYSNEQKSGSDPYQGTGHERHNGLCGIIIND
jgi:hypothetical protein